MAHLQLVDKIQGAINDNKNAVGMLLDLSAAFDTVNHDMLLGKLKG